MMAFRHFFDPILFGTEFVFTAIAVIFCLLIYFKTREVYNLTKHKGIKYFRDAFLFFGLSYILRFLFSLVFLSRIAFDFVLPRAMFMPLFILPLGYFSTIGIFYLVFSSIWKRFNNRRLIILGNIIAILLSLISFITRSHFILLSFQSVLLVFAITLSIFVHRGEKKASGIKILYLLISTLWLINLWVIVPRRSFSLETEVFFQFVSLSVFIVIYYKLSKWIK